MSEPERQKQIDLLLIQKLVKETELEVIKKKLRKLLTAETQRNF